MTCFSWGRGLSRDSAVKASTNRTIDRIWGICDAALLLLVFVLAGWMLAGRPGPAPAVRPDVPRPAAGVPAGIPAPAAPARLPVRPAALARPAVNGARPAAGRIPLRQIARSFASASEWDGAPSLLALDMRENGRAYEIALSLPRGIGEEGVRFRASGRVLTLAMQLPDGRGLIRRQVRIPCEIVREDQMRAFLTNGVLQILITPFRAEDGAPHLP